MNPTQQGPGIDPQGFSCVGPSAREVGRTQLFPVSFGMTERVELTQLGRILMWEGEGVVCDMKKFSRRGKWRL